MQCSLGRSSGEGDFGLSHPAVTDLGWVTCARKGNGDTDQGTHGLFQVGVGI